LHFREVFRKVEYIPYSSGQSEAGGLVGLCPAEDITRRALELNGRLFVHYMQPHFPALGEPRLLLNENEISQKVAKGELDAQLVREAYKGNLAYVLREAEKLIKGLQPRKCVITSDHGELLGEGGRWGHPSFDSGPILREVPWLEITSG
jgi:hypothetical protein